MNYNFVNEESTVVQVMFQAFLNAETGEILALNKATGVNLEMLEIVTKDILKQAFPNIQRQGFSLSQAEEGEEEEIVFGSTTDEVQIDLGTVEADIDVSETEESIIVETAYTEENLVEFGFDLGGELPAIQFEETKIINKELGLVSRSERMYTFSLNSQFDNLNQNEDGDDDSFSMELLGAMSVEISSEMALEGVTFDQAVFMNHPMPSFAVDLTSNTGSFWVHPEAEQSNNNNLTNNNLGDGSATFEKDY